MEIDLLCADSRVVSEIDGAQLRSRAAAIDARPRSFKRTAISYCTNRVGDSAKEPDLVLDGILPITKVRSDSPEDTISTISTIS